MLLGLFCFHIIVASIFIFVPDVEVGVAPRLYRMFTAIGPFFTSRNLSSSFHVVAEVRHADQAIEKIDLTNKFQNDYNAHPWKYQMLLKKIYIRHVTGSLGRNYRRGLKITSDTLQTQLGQVRDFLHEEIVLEKGDSVYCGFLWKKFYPAEGIYKTDTMFYLPILMRHD